MTYRRSNPFGRRVLACASFLLLTTCTDVQPPTAQGPDIATAPLVSGITQTLLTSGNSAVNQRVYTTASIAPAANALITVAVLGHASSSAPAIPTVTGGGMTGWTVVSSVTFDGVSSPHKRLTIYRALSAAPGSGPITITFPSSVSNCQWIVSQWSGVDPSGTNGAGAIAQTGSKQGDAATGLTVSLGAFGNANDVAYGAFGIAKNAVAVTPGSGFAEIAEQPSAEGTASDLEAEWATNVNAIAASWASANAGGLGVEIVASGTPPATTNLALTVTGTGSIAQSLATRSGGTCANPATASCTGVYFTTDNVTLTATAPAGWTFTGWTGDCTGTSTCALVMTANHAVTATFTPVASHTLTVTVSGSGQVSLSPAPGAGSTCTNPTSTSCTAVYSATDNVTLTPASGNFTGWSGDCTGTGSCTLAMSADHAVTVSFGPASTGAITHTLLTSGNNAVNQRVYVTASIAPAANALITVAVLGHSSSGAPATPTLSGGGMTAWTVVSSITFDGVSSTHKRLTIYRALSAAPGSGPLTITFASSVSNCQWVVSQWSGVDPSGTNGAGAIAQTGSKQGDAATGLTVSLGAFGNANDVAYGAFGIAKNAVAVTPGSGFTEIAEQPSAEGTAADLEAEWATNHPAIAASWASANGGGLGLEIKAGNGVPQVLDLSIDRIYVTQATQTLGNTVSLVSGRTALVRVFLHANSAAPDVPAVRVSVFNGGSLVTSAMIAGTHAAPTATDESDLSSSWNVSVSGGLIHTGYSIVAEVDPGHLITESNEANNSLTYTEAPRSTAPQAYRFVPIQQSANGLTGDVSAANVATYADLANRIWPILPPSLDIHQTYLTNAAVNSGSDAAWSQILSEIDAMRVAEGTAMTYVGVVKITYTVGIDGIGYIGFPTAVVADDSAGRGVVTAHELGHTYGREHAPGCGAGSPDRRYPYAGGTIGVFGTDVFANPAVLYPPSTHDIMGYCDDNWISDYNYLGVLNFLTTSNLMQGVAALPAQRSILIWGSIRNGVPYLEPAFVLDARPSGPSTAGTYRVEGLDKDGVVLFSQAFEPTPVADERSGQDSHFAFALPLSDAVQSRLVSLRLVGLSREFVRAATAGYPQAAAPSGQKNLVRSWQGRNVVMEWDTLATPMVMVRDAGTGQILSIGRGGRVAVVTSASGLDLLLSTGVGSTVQRVAAPVR